MGRQVYCPDTGGEYPMTEIACPAESIVELRSSLDRDRVGRNIFELIAQLFPICRSITGDGLRKTLKEIGKIIPLKVHEVHSGTKLFDWTVPKEWNIRDAYIK